ncbi:MAG: response regulator [Geobacter sp.]
MMKRFLIIDDHAMVRQGLVAVLRGNTEHQISCDEAGSAEQALELLASSPYDLTILDISLPGMGGLELLPLLHQKYQHMPVLMLSMFPEEQFALRALRLGASGYLTKQEAADELLAAVNHVLSGQRYLSRSFSATLINQAVVGTIKAQQPNHSTLSNREFEILRRLAAGQALKVISDELGISIKTVSTYKTRLCSKMGFKNNADLINYAISNKVA